MSLKTTLFGRLFRLNTDAESPRWQLAVWDRALFRWQPVGGSGVARTPLQLRADPPDFVTLNGELVYIQEQG